MKIVLLAQEGFTLRQMVEITGLPKSTIYSRLASAGVKLKTPRGGGYARCLPHQEIVKTAFMHTEMGLGVNEIARRLGVRHSTVQHRLDLAGVRRKRGN